MSYNVATDGLFGVCSKHGGSIDLGHDLVGDDNGNSKFVGNTLEHAEKLRQVHLTG
jgi:hypothetical protein